MAAKRAPVLDHLVNMTDDVGMFQHARFDVPLRSAGYCTDDIGRALIVSIEAARNRATEAIGDKLSTIYLSYMQDAQLSDGWFHNFMGYDRQWQDVRGGEDTFGRAMWGLGYAMLRAPRDSWRMIARNIVHNALPHVESLSYLRARAYTALGLVPAVAAAVPDAEALRTALRSAVEPIVVAYEAHRQPGWNWCEDLMTYDNARIPEACLRAGEVLGDHRYMRAGTEMLDFYASVVVENGMFVPIGNNGWYRHNGPRAIYGQQAVGSRRLRRQPMNSRTASPRTCATGRTRRSATTGFSAAIPSGF